MRLFSDITDVGIAQDFHLDGVCGVYRISQNTLCIELYANKIIDGTVQKVVVLRNTWDRSCWLAAQQTLARIFAEVAALPNADEERPVLVH